MAKRREIYKGGRVRLDRRGPCTWQTTVSDPRQSYASRARLGVRSTGSPVNGGEWAP